VQYVNHSCSKHSNVMFWGKDIKGVCHTKRLEAGAMLLTNYDQQHQFAFGCHVCSQAQQQ